MRARFQVGFFFFTIALGAAHSVHADCVVTGNVSNTPDLPEITVTGYQDTTLPEITVWANKYPTSPSKPYSANPNAHVTCTASVLSNAQEQGSKSTPSQPNNTALAPPLRNANPIDISNSSPVGKAYGGTNTTSGFMAFADYSDGTNAAMSSLAAYAANGKTITQLVNTWSNKSPAAMATFLSVMGMTQTTANQTYLYTLTAAQQLQVIAGFAWGEGFKPSGC